MFVRHFSRRRRRIGKGRAGGFHAAVAGIACLFAQTALAADTIRLAAEIPIALPCSERSPNQIASIKDEIVSQLRPLVT